jgi:hypothetical protein
MASLVLVLFPFDSRFYHGAPFSLGTIGDGASFLAGAVEQQRLAATPWGIEPLLRAAGSNLFLRQIR